MAEGFTEGSRISDTKAVLWGNNFLRLLGAKAKIKASQTYATSIADTGYDLPTDFIEEWKVELHSASTFTDSTLIDLYKNYILADEHIYFDTSGNFKLYYFKMPTELQSVNDTLDIDQAFYISMALYLASQYLTYDDEDHAGVNTLGSLRRSEFEREFNRACGVRLKRFFVPETIVDVY